MAFYARDLRYCSLGCKIAFQNRKMPLRINRIGPRTNHVLIRTRLVRHVIQHFSYSLATNCERIAVQSIVNREHLHHLRNSARSMQISGHITPGRFEIAKHRNARTNVFKVINRQPHIGRVGYRQQMQHRIG